VRLPGLQARNEVRVVARVAYSRTGQGIHRFVDPVDDRVYTYTDFEPFDAHRAFACFDQPDIKAEFTFDVVAPASWIVVSNMPQDGEPIESDDASSRRWRFETTPRMSAYITAVAAGEYHMATDTSTDIPMGWLCRQSLAKHMQPDEGELFEITKQGFDFYSRVFDYPYPFGKYDQVFVPEFNSGAMENIGCVTYNELYIFRSKVTDAARERRAETILHEMAHMWFGDLVTMRWWDDLWLNESFATFMSVLCETHATRWRGAWTTFANSEKTWAYFQDQLPSTSTRGRRNGSRRPASTCSVPGSTSRTTGRSRRSASRRKRRPSTPSCACTGWRWGCTTRPTATASCCGSGPSSTSPGRRPRCPSSWASGSPTSCSSTTAT
jgi:aminopeptidase N